MTTLVNTFSAQQPQGSLKFVSYDGTLKQTSRRIPKKKKAAPGDGDRGNSSDNRSGVVDRDDDWPLPHREGGVSYEQNPKQTSRRLPVNQVLPDSNK